jgi:signal transduction histidine kinase
MKNPQSAFFRLYQSELRRHIAGGPPPDPPLIAKIGAKARGIELPMMEFVKFHENLLVTTFLPPCPVAQQAALIHKAGIFFASAVAATHVDDREAAHLGNAVVSLSVRTVELAAANRRLEKETVRLGEVKSKLGKSEAGLRAALEKSEGLRGSLCKLSRQTLSAQEDERRKISHELHDVVAQTLAIINLRLATLNTEAGIGSKRLARNIDLTRKLVTKAAESVYDFARELRPAALDDLGLIPALNSFMRAFTKRTGVRSNLTVFKGVEKLSAAKRTAIYRITQEAFTNVGRHARAGRVEVNIRREAKFVQLVVADDGIPTLPGQPLRKRGGKRLGMRERAEMTGGTLDIESAPGKGTTIIARIPISKATERRWQDEHSETSTAIP